MADSRAPVRCPGVPFPRLMETPPEMLTLLHLLSSIALLVWGTHIVRTGIMRVYGSHLRRVLGRSMNHSTLAFGAGVGVTALVQSSNATALLAISFVAQGLMALPTALAVMLGADVGTALMARVLTLDTARRPRSSASIWSTTRCAARHCCPRSA